MNLNVTLSEYRLLTAVCVIASVNHSPLLAQETCDIVSSKDTVVRVQKFKSYDERVENARNKWMRMIPNLFLTQFAGNIGFLSFGIGWDSGKNEQWESHAMLGFIPHFAMNDDMMTFTIRECFVPWQLGVNGIVSVSPLVASMSVNTVFNNEFWFTENERYPGDYYRFSSKLRTQIGLGGRINLHFTNYQRKETDRLSLYYEVSTYDLAIISYVPNRRTLHLRDILALGIGLQYKFF